MRDLLGTEAHREFVRKKVERETRKLEQAMAERKALRDSQRKEYARIARRKRAAPKQIIVNGITYIRADSMEE